MGYDTDNILAKVLDGRLPSTVVGESPHAKAIVNVDKTYGERYLILPKGPYSDIVSFIKQGSEFEVASLFKLMADVAIQKNILNNSTWHVNHEVLGRQQIPHFHLVPGDQLTRVIPNNQGAFLVQPDQKVLGPIISDELDLFTKNPVAAQNIYSLDEQISMQDFMEGKGLVSPHSLFRDVINGVSPVGISMNSGYNHRVIGNLPFQMVGHFGGAGERVKISYTPGAQVYFKGEVKPIELAA